MTYIYKNITVVPNELRLDKPLRIKYGIDPTGTSVHLGHTVPLLKLKQFQELGHQVILIIGDATALIGDPSGRDKTRVGLTTEKIRDNSRTYLDQIGKIINLSQAIVKYNSEWFSGNILDIMRLLSKVTLQQLTSRADFSQRIQSNNPVFMHELLYPIMQGWDSVMVKADVELGGTEQLFNLMMGRHLQVSEGMSPQICITIPLLIGTDGVQKMGKSLNNYIGINDSPFEQFSKTMSIPDLLMPQWFSLLFNQDIPKLDPMSAKKLLGFQIVKQYHGESKAIESQQEWTNQFSNRQNPSEIPTVKVNSTDIISILTSVGISSRSEARRLIEQGAIKWNGIKINKPIELNVSEGILKIGPRRIFKICQEIL